jgi:hypothetical protein
MVNRKPQRPLRVISYGQVMYATGSSRIGRGFRFPSYISGSPHCVARDFNVGTFQDPRKGAETDELP